MAISTIVTGGAHSAGEHPEAGDQTQYDSPDYSGEDVIKIFLSYTTAKVSLSHINRNQLFPSCFLVASKLIRNHFLVSILPSNFSTAYVIALALIPIADAIIDG